MSRSFASASSQYAEYAGAVVAAASPPYTFACWFRPATVSVFHCLMAMSNTGTNRSGSFMEVYNDNTLNVYSANNAGPPQQAKTSAVVTAANTWYHCCGVFTSSANRTAYVNAGNINNSTVSQTIGTANTTSVGRIANWNGSAIDYANGQIAHAAVWNAALTAEEVSDLTNGTPVWKIRPGSLVAYWPLRGKDSPEPDFALGGFNLTLGNSPTAGANEAPVTYSPSGMTWLDVHDQLFFPPRQQFDMPLDANDAWMRTRAQMLPSSGVVVPVYLPPSPQQRYDPVPESPWFPQGEPPLTHIQAQTRRLPQQGDQRHDPIPDPPFWSQARQPVANVQAQTPPPNRVPGQRQNWLAQPDYPWWTQFEPFVTNIQAQASPQPRQGSQRHDPEPPPPWWWQVEPPVTNLQAQTAPPTRQGDQRHDPLPEWVWSQSKAFASNIQAQNPPPVHVPGQRQNWLTPPEPAWWSQTLVPSNTQAPKPAVIRPLYQLPYFPLAVEGSTQLLVTSNAVLAYQPMTVPANPQRHDPLPDVVITPTPRLIVTIPGMTIDPPIGLVPSQRYDIPPDPYVPWAAQPHQTIAGPAIQAPTGLVPQQRYDEPPPPWTAPQRLAFSPWLAPPVIFVSAPTLVLSQRHDAAPEPYLPPPAPAKLTTQLIPAPPGKPLTQRHDATSETSFVAEPRPRTVPPSLVPANPRPPVSQRFDAPPDADRAPWLAALTRLIVQQAMPPPLRRADQRHDPLPDAPATPAFVRVVAPPYPVPPPPRRPEQRHDSQEQAFPWQPYAAHAYPTPPPLAPPAPLPAPSQRFEPAPDFWTWWMGRGVTLLGPGITPAPPPPALRANFLWSADVTATFLWGANMAQVIALPAQYRGEDKLYTGSPFGGPASVPVGGIAGWTIQVTLRTRLGAVLFVKPVQVVDGANGVISFVILNADTESFPADTYYLFVERTDTGTATELASGPLTVYDSAIPLATPPAGVGGTLTLSATQINQGGSVTVTTTATGPYTSATLDGVPVTTPTSTQTFTLQTGHTYTFVVQGPGGPKIVTATVTVAGPTQTTSSGNFSVTFSASGQSFSFSGTVTGSVVNEGTMTLSVLSGSTVIGVPVTVPVVNSAFSGTYALPAGTAAGVYTAKLVYSGTPNFESSTDASHTLTINKATSTVAAANASCTASGSNQTVNLSATVTSPAGAVNEGTVTFTVKNGATVIGTPVTSSPVVNGAATAGYVLPAGTSAGTYTIQAVYSGMNLLGSTDSAHTLAVAAASPASTVTAASSASATFSTTDQAVSLSATVASGGNPIGGGGVTFTILNGSTVVGTPITSGIVTAGAASATWTLPANTAAGTYTIQAAYSGNANYQSSSDSGHSLTVATASTTIVGGVLSTPFNASSQTVPVSATVTSPAGVVNEGTVTFTLKLGGVTVGTPVTSGTISAGVATANYVIPAGQTAGSYTLTCHLNPGSDFASTTDDTPTFTIAAAATTTTAASAASNVFSSQASAVTLNATVTGSPAVNVGTVTFTVKQGSTVIGSPVTSGTVSAGAASVSYPLPASTPAATYTIQAVFNPVGVYGSSSDSSHSLTVSQASTSVACSPAVATAAGSNQNVTLSASVTSPTGPVSEGTVTFTVKTQAGSTVGSPVTSGTVAHNQTSATYVLPGGTSAQGLTITAAYNAGSDYTAGSNATNTLTVNPATSAAPTTTTASNASVPFASAGVAVPLTATVTSTGGAVNEGTVTFTVLSGSTVIGSPVTSGTVSGGTATASFLLPANTAPGVYTVQAAYAGTANFTSSGDATHTLSVTAASVTVTAANLSANTSGSNQTLALSATVTSAGGQVSQGTVTFTLVLGSTVIGTPVTSATVAAGVAGVSYVLPANSVAGSYAIQAVYSGSADYTGVTGTPGTLNLTAASGGSATAVLTLSTNVLVAGQSATLAWTTSNSTSVILQGNTVAASGSMTVSPSVTTTYTLTANVPNGSGSSAVATATVAVVPVGTSAGAATFLGQDAATLNGWEQNYGAEGYAIASYAHSKPSYGFVTTQAPPTVWALATTVAVTNALDRLGVNGSVQQVATAWKSASPFTVNVSLTDGQAHSVALYFTDFDGQGRSARVDVLDAFSGAVLDTRNISSFTGGIYLKYSLSGCVAIKVTPLSGPDGVMSAVFFGGASYLAPVHPGVPAQPLQKALLRKEDFTWLGAVAIPSSFPNSGDLSWAQGGIGLRFYGGNTYVYSYGSAVQAFCPLYVMQLPPLASFSKNITLGSHTIPNATFVTNYGTSVYTLPSTADARLLTVRGSGNGTMQGAYWDAVNNRLYGSFGNPYNIPPNNEPSLLYFDGIGAGNPATESPVVHKVPAADPTIAHCQKIRGGNTQIPAYFASAYTGGRTLGVGFGGYYSGQSQGSNGPYLGAATPPTDSTTQLDVMRLLDFPATANKFGRRDPNYNTAVVGLLPPDPTTDVGYWTWADNTLSSGCWVDLPDKHGVLFLGLVGQGQVAYTNSTVVSTSAENYLFVYDPSDLAAVAQSTKNPWDVVPAGIFQVLLPPYLGGQGVPRYVGGMALDATNRILYVMQPFSYNRLTVIHAFSIY